MFYDDEELLEAIDILMEEYGFAEDEAIDMVLEESLSSKLVNATSMVGAAYMGRKLGKKLRDYRSSKKQKNEKLEEGFKDYVGDPRNLKNSGREFARAGRQFAKDAAIPAAGAAMVGGALLTRRALRKRRERKN